MPRPTRLRGWFAPGAGLIALSRIYSSSLSMYPILLIMPRTAAVSSTSTVWLMRRKPSPRMVARWLSRVLIGLRTRVTLMVLPLPLLFPCAAISPPRDLFDTLATLGSNLGGSRHRRERIQRGAHDVIGVGRPEALGQDILHTHHLEHRPHGASRNDPGPIRGRLNQHLGSTVPADHRVIQRAFLEADLDHPAARLLHRLLYRHRHLTRFALAHADATITIAHHGERSEPQDASAFHDLGHAIHRDHLLAQAIAALFARCYSALRCSRHDNP